MNSKAIQTIAAILFIFLLSVYICLQTKQAKKLSRLITTKLRQLLKIKEQPTTMKSKEELNEGTKSELQHKPDPPQSPKTILSNGFFQRNSPVAPPLRSISQVIESKRLRILHFFLNSYIYGYILLVLVVILLTIIQIVLIDLNNLELFNLKRKIKNDSRLITYLCANLERNYYTEEIIYLVFALLFFLLLIFKQKKRRFR